jgi:hypothetical protein
MRIVTWNCCRGPLGKKAPLLSALGPDISVLQECAKPGANTRNTLWFGDNPNIGLAVQASGGYSLRALPPIMETPKYVIPISVSGPREFTLFAVWTLGTRPFRYVEAAARAVDLYRDVIRTSPSVLMGDFNSNRIWDRTHRRGFNHSSLVQRLDDLGLVSAYHHQRKEEHGQESEPTFHLQKKKERPYHIDYCFLPRTWAEEIARVEIGDYETWRKHSDHMPLLVEVADGLG